MTDQIEEIDGKEKPWLLRAEVHLDEKGNTAKWSFNL